MRWQAAGHAILRQQTRAICQGLPDPKHEHGMDAALQRCSGNMLVAR